VVWTERTTQRSGSETLAHDAQDHGALVDDEACAAHMVVCVLPHVRVGEGAPFHLGDVEAPYHGHFW
jgi:hypothetical protein